MGLRKRSTKNQRRKTTTRENIIEKQVTELRALNLRLERNQMTMTELRLQTEEQQRNNVKDNISNRNESIEMVKIVVIDKEKKSIMEGEFQQQMNKINKNIRNIEITKEPTGTNGNVAILTIAKTETVEKTIKEINNTVKWSANKTGNKTNLEHNRTLILTKEMTGKKVPILTGKKKEHNAMHVGLETTKLNIAAKTAIYLYHTEKRST